MAELIATIIFLISLCAVLYILLRKMPALHKMPLDGTSGLEKLKVVSNTKNKFKDFYHDLFVKQTLLHKLLSFLKICILRIETKIDAWLHKIRRNSQQHKR